jgi:hypothetical protein
VEPYAVDAAGRRRADALRAFWTFLGPSTILAYLAMMAPRLVELRRVADSNLGRTRTATPGIML